jgi:hypothetical protein
MLTAIEFNSQTMTNAIEIQDESFHWMLPSELVAA